MDHNRDFDPRYGEAVALSDGIRRITAPNSGAFTFHGTNTYLIGIDPIIVVDPGPDLDSHIETILRATSGAEIAAIAVTHTHVDHSPAARRLKDLSHAPVIGCGPHRAARDLKLGEINPMDASADRDYQPDVLMGDGDRFDAGGLTLEAIATPGHTQNHLSFALLGTPYLLSGDHVMAWSTSIVAPPDGNMRAYLSSLDKLMGRPEHHFLPGHGAAIADARPYMADLRAHRLRRETAIMEQLATGAKTIPELVELIYLDLPDGLKGAAALSVFAQLEDLVDRGRVAASPELLLNARYQLA
ncbi:MBL fold metallo-hydrolase [Roseibium aquae]|uniref:MBL fold metallo-hydrolase n=1 Tax=Roseibium aquae TaxID=1323746 RepID=A0A916X2L1_9HYPH|nr:MBL fold metallo-hydrolase [Roseibium aquae]GGB51386.1 MBL fold metallo-hydrolase [Roseibium aquae]